MRFRACLLFGIVIGSFGCSPNAEQPVATSSGGSNATEIPKTELPSSAAPSGVAPNASNVSDVIRWVPEPSMDSLLSPPEIIEGFSIRPPAGYSGMVASGAPQGFMTKVWKGEARPDGTSPSVQLMLMSPPLSNSIPNVDVGVRKALDGLQRIRANWTESPVTRGTMHGVDFSRVTWTGDHKEMGVKMQGVIYIAMLNGVFIQLSTQDLDVHASDSIKLCESSLRTFAKN
ncbi:MAG: hypothetical protein ACK56W_00220 [Pirellula sp.]|jgi:hypothetical protein|nr:hypothetical protein [Pirellula sp.]